MSPLSTTLWSAAFVVGLTTFLFERHTFNARESRLSALANGQERLQREIARLRHATDSAAGAERAATDALAKLESATHPASSNPLAAESSAWLARFRQLKQLFATRPEQRIPEMDLLSDRDVLMCARDASFATEDDARRALARVRNAAKQRFAHTLAPAVRAYQNANQGKPPANVAALAPFLSPPLNATHLHRWEVIPPKGDGPVYDLLTEKAPIDADHDSRVRVQTSGGLSIMSPPLAWIPDFADRSRAAHQAFIRANHGATAPGFSALLPYFDPPFDAATAEKLLRFERERAKP